MRSEKHASLCSLECVCPLGLQSKAAGAAGAAKPCCQRTACALRRRQAGQQDSSWLQRCGLDLVQWCACCAHKGSKCTQSCYPKFSLYVWLCTPHGDRGSARYRGRMVQLLRGGVISLRHPHSSSAYPSRQSHAIPEQPHPAGLVPRGNDQVLGERLHRLCMLQSGLCCLVARLAGQAEGDGLGLPFRALQGCEPCTRSLPE